MKTPDGTQTPAKFPPTLLSNSLPQRKLHRRGTVKPVLVWPVSRLRRSEVPATPLHGWKFDDGRNFPGEPTTGSASSRRVRGEEVISVSARKLAAGMWQLAVDVTSNTAFEITKGEETAIVPIISSSLQGKLEQARGRIKELEIEQKSSKKEVVHFLRKLSEEGKSWKRRENQKLRALSNDLNRELIKERRTFHKIEHFSSKMFNDLAEAKSSVAKIKQDYEREKKSRELMDEVCNELAKKNEKGKIEIEELKREFVNICEEIGEEKKMKQMAEVWLEEKVSIKLTDAKLILEEKYQQMNNLVTDLEDFLRSRGDFFDMIEINDVQ